MRYLILCAVVTFLSPSALATQPLEATAPPSSAEPPAECARYDAGFRVERIAGNNGTHTRPNPQLIDWWYPTQQGTAEPMNYGLGRGMVNEDGEVAPGTHPLVLLSHGAMGAARNYSWLAEHLACNGYVVAGVSHYGESYVYGQNTVDPKQVLDPWQRPKDVRAVLLHALQDSTFSPHIDERRIAFVGHSSGGATALLLAGASFDPQQMATYCAGPGRTQDKGCEYADIDSRPPAPNPLKRTPQKVRLPTIRAFIALDPALGPGLTGLSELPEGPDWLIVGAIDNDFLPAEHHALAIARQLPDARRLWLNEREGHFVFLNRCALPLEANGVALCTDRPGVSRTAVHGTLKLAIQSFLGKALPKPTSDS